MASIQCERSEEFSMQLSFEEKSCLDEVIKQGEFDLQSQELLDQSLAVVAEQECLDRAAAAALRTSIRMLGGTLKNQTRGPLTVMATKKFAGHIVRNYPNPLNSAGAFAFSAMSDKGIKAAVVYSGKNKAGVDCAWLLAFCDTKDYKRRIYAECGRKSKFVNINWATIENKLNNAGSVAKPSDKETGTSLYATIVGTSGKSVVAAAYMG